ncbi:MAG: FKBP-type peptidyl-prolyl cis-trans isomerase [Crocinitomicaceae bacterium]
MKKILLFTPLFILSACSGETEEEKDYVETKYDIEVSKYLEDKAWEPERQESGLYVYLEKEGSAEKPTLQDFLTIIYEGRLLDGTVFDGTDGQAVSFPFPVSGLIKGWQEGLPHFGKGGKGKLIIPPDLAYGEKATGGIPPNSVLVFDIELVDFSAEEPAPQIDMSVDYSDQIDAYIAEKGLKNPIKTETGLYIFIDKEGSAEKPSVNDFLTLNYEGYLMDGTTFDGTGGNPTTFDFPLKQTIMGWQEGIPYFGKGGKGKLIIPPYIGYGSREAGDIPANSILVFDIEIVDYSDTPPAVNQQKL